jgi:tetratricopeptide (TPR) repeat protein
MVCLPTDAPVGLCHKMKVATVMVALSTILFCACLVSAQPQPNYSRSPIPISSPNKLSDSIQLDQELEKRIKLEVESQVKTEIERLKTEIQLQFKTEALNNLGPATSWLGALATILGVLVAVFTLGSIVTPLLLLGLRGYIFRKLSSTIRDDILEEITKEKADALKEIKKLRLTAKTQIATLVSDIQTNENSQTPNSPDSITDPWYERGNSLKDEKYYLKAIESYIKTTTAKPDYHEAWYKIARCYALLGAENINQVVENLKKAIELDPKYIELVKKESDFNEEIKNHESFIKILRLVAKE